MVLVKKNIIAWIIGLFVVINIGIFVLLNIQPILWTNDEIMWHGFFWSMNGMDDYQLHTGFNAVDFLKPFVPFYVDGDLRFRQVSYFFEMISFKFWQLFGEVYLRNWTLILLHIFNVALIWRLVACLTECRRTAWVCGLFFLNAGIAMSTLMYPFRNAKMLVVTWLLLAWLLSIPKNIKFLNLPNLHWILFWALFLVAGFTDEMSLFLFPLIFLFAGIRDGFKQFLSMRFYRAVGFFLGMYAFLVFAVTKISQQVSLIHISANAQSSFLLKMKDYFLGGQMWHDLFVAYTQYFIPVSFGSWDISIWGRLAIISSVFLLILAIINKVDRLSAKTVLIIACVFILKSILLPHNGEYHTTIMPVGTIFPSLLFFGWYYVYPEIMMVALILGLLLKNSLQKSLWIVVVLLGVTIINISNFVHFKNGPINILSFMHFNVPERQEMIKDILKLDVALKQHSHQKVYVAFPSGDDAIVKARRHEPTRSMYERIIPVRYLSKLEKGELFLAYSNVPRFGVDNINEVLSVSDYFYDVYSGESYDLSIVRKKMDVDKLQYKILSGSQGFQSTLKLSDNAHEIIFFVRGRSLFLLESASHKEVGEQNYGNAFQMFRFSAGDFDSDSGQVIFKMLKLNSADCVLVGPFVM